METIFETLFGSHLYGTETDLSDTDYKGVFIPNARAILMGRVLPSINLNPKVDHKTGSQAKNSPEDIDFELYSLKRFIDLACDGQTVALDMLFATPLIRDNVIDGVYTAPWVEIWNNRDKLATRKAKAFLGYARQQANKYGIKGSRMAAAEKATNFFRAKEVFWPANTKLAEIWDEIVKELVPIEHCDVVMTVRGSDGGKMRAFECCNRKALETASIKTAADMYAKLFDDYGERARAAKNSEGVDWKALSHAVRVGRQAIEYLDTGHIVFPRPEAGHLLKIKSGEVLYQEVAEEIESLLVRIESAAAESTLPEYPDLDWCEDFVFDCYKRVVSHG